MGMKPCENNVEKGENAGNLDFLLIPQCSYGINIVDNYNCLTTEDDFAL